MIKESSFSVKSVQNIQCTPDCALIIGLTSDFNQLIELSECIGSSEPVWCTGDAVVASYLCYDQYFNFEVVIEEPKTFSLTCDDYDIDDFDMDCVSERIMEATAQFEALDAAIQIVDFDIQQDITTTYVKQLCSRYCTERLQSFPPLFISRLIDCENSYSCCITRTSWEIGVISDPLGLDFTTFIPSEVTTEVYGSCSGSQAPVCGKGGSLNQICSARSCSVY